MYCGPHRLQDKRKSSRGKDSLYLEDGGNWRPLINVLKPRTLISGSVSSVSSSSLSSESSQRRGREPFC